MTPEHFCFLCQDSKHPVCLFCGRGCENLLKAYKHTKDRYKHVRWGLAGYATPTTLLTYWFSGWPACELTWFHYALFTSALLAFVVAYLLRENA